ncbi:hypothetical protein [Levilactobacillus suantsaii]|uniref:DUF1659 domain-containing protein n=1 Tax=Levilactobacillus suantsaii TaxID=2292255 RepID=A0A4Q0VGK4_9LACO|nr:hypothetical protein [Levilactobacillus suantsaii]QMU08349.1 hypothetical protein H3M12_01325 [Levilactobacillus suantsaii]RXI77235.1 hypothetical protein DXH47_09510 [Levilactobacillus suantsaii]
MTSKWTKTSITFLMGDDLVHPVRIALNNGVAEPTSDQIEAFGSYLADLTGLTFRHANVTTQNDVA